MSAAMVFRAIKHDGLTADERLVLIILANRSDTRGDCWPSQQWVAKACGLHRTTVNRALRGLEHKGCIVRASRYGKNGKRTTDHVGVFGGSLCSALRHTPVAESDSIPTTSNDVSRKKGKSLARKGAGVTLRIISGVKA